MFDSDMDSLSNVVREFVKQKITEDDPFFEIEVENCKNRFRFNTRIGKMQLEPINRTSLERETTKPLGPKAKERFFDREFSTEFLKFLIMGETEALYPSSYRKFVNGKLPEVSEKYQKEWIEVIKSFIQQLNNSLGSNEEKLNGFNEFLCFYHLQDLYCQMQDLYYQTHEPIIYSQDELQDELDDLFKT